MSAQTEAYQNYIVGSSVYNMSTYMYERYEGYAGSSEEAPVEDESTGGRFRSLRVVRAIRAIRNQVVGAPREYVSIGYWDSCARPKMIDYRAVSSELIKLTPHQ